MIEVSSRGAAPDSSAGAPPLADRARISLPSFYSLRRCHRLGSTNDEAKSLAGAGAVEGTLVWALEQSQGRGRQGRVWASPPGNFYASIVLRPAARPEAAAQLGFAAALAVREACIDFAPDAAITFKWPNDVLLAGRKLAGILLESQMRGDGRIDWLVAGMGINLVTYPLATEYPATALSAEGVEIAPDAMLGAVARRFLAWYQRWCERRDFTPLREAWLRHAHGIGEALRVRQPNGQLSGRFAGLGGDGALLLDTAEGSRRIEAGEVFPAEPAA
jgi:BirA family biotin operon repressor/biotin-[acetyl-CoA-carboxylase] ligase